MGVSLKNTLYISKPEPLLLRLSDKNFHHLFCKLEKTSITPRLYTVKSILVNNIDCHIPIIIKH